LIIPPKTFKDLFEFYNEYVKVLYSDMQIHNALPNEVLFEINAAFDHVSRYYVLGESEEYAAQRAYGHLKRSCLDIFKLKVKEAIKCFDDLCRVDTSVIDLGQFDRDLIMIVGRMKLKAVEARQFEGDKRSDKEDKVIAFDKWQPAYDDAITIINDYYLNPKVDWAKKRMRLYTTKQFILSLAASFVAGILFWIVIHLLFPNSPI
jgi:hypothetical protein